MRQPTTVTVSIGRNVGEEPMDDARWNDYRSATVEIVERFARVVFSGTGTGFDPGSKVAIEQSFTLVGTLFTNITGLYHELATLAVAFEQDSIALTTGNTSFPGSEV